tara:strand:- start:1183 stop:1449 length:267 start_codon:yes stop_codon:yes gene_type:complete
MTFDNLQIRALEALIESLDEEIKEYDIKVDMNYAIVDILVDHIINTQGIDSIYKLNKEINSKIDDDGKKNWLVSHIEYLDEYDPKQCF